MAIMRWKSIKNQTKYVVCSSDTEFNFDLAYKYFNDNNIQYYCLADYYLDLIHLFKTGKFKWISHFDQDKNIFLDAHNHGIIDHCHLYKSKDGKIYLICHNYDMEKTYPYLIEWCNKNGLNLEKQKVSWYENPNPTYIKHHTSTSTYVITLKQS